MNLIQVCIYKPITLNMRKCRGAAGPMILQVNLVRAETTHRQCSSRSCRKGSFCGQACLFRESSLLWPIKAIGSASGLPTNNLEKAFGTRAAATTISAAPGFRKRLVGSIYGWKCMESCVGSSALEHKPNLDTVYCPE